MIMLLEVAAQSQYLLGEKTRAWISSPAFKEERSQTLTSLTHPLLTMTGFWGLGLNLT